MGTLVRKFEQTEQNVKNLKVILISPIWPFLSRDIEHTNQLKFEYRKLKEQDL